MKIVAVALTALTCATCHHEPKPPVMEFLDPVAVDLSTVDDLHRHRVKAICKVGPDRPEVMLQLCRDKGFDGVTFETISVALLKQAERLGLAVITAPSGSADKSTTNGS